MEEFIKAEKLHPHLQSIHDDGLQRTTSPVKNNNIRNGTIVLPDESCLARLSDDGEWCNGLVTDVYGDGSAQVYFTDYGNSERVKKTNIVREIKDLPVGAKLNMNVD